jgi:hypothetical protein
MKNLSSNNKILTKTLTSNEEDIKTTNINILLNRVKLNKKQDTKKKIAIVALLLSIFGTTSLLLFF